jgi:hypothetical protein
LNESRRDSSKAEHTEFYNAKKVGPPKQRSPRFSPAKSPELKQKNNDLIESVKKKATYVTPQRLGSSSKKDRDSGNKSQVFVMEWNE